MGNNGASTGASEQSGKEAFRPTALMGRGMGLHVSRQKSRRTAGLG